LDLPIRSIHDLKVVAAAAAVAMLASLCGGAQEEARPGPIRVEIRNEDGRFHLLRDGRPYLIKGAIWVGDQGGRVPLKDVAERGGNSIRTGASAQVLDEAHRLGLSVLVNLPMRMESVHKFDYSDEKAVREQFEKMKERVLQVKDHPAVLMYAIGNELSVGYKNRQVWNAVNDVARMIHEVDPNHPAMTVIGDGSINSGDIQELLKQPGPVLSQGEDTLVHRGNAQSRRNRAAFGIGHGQIEFGHFARAENWFG